MTEFQRKVALIVGGTSGLGRAAVAAFAREGARIVVSGRDDQRGMDVVREAEAAGATAIFVRCDIRRASDIQALIDRAVAAFGRIDYAFNSAGADESVFLTTVELSEEQFDQSIATNLKGTWLCMKHEIRQMLRQVPAGGAIVNTSSVDGLGGAARGSVYSATKAGVLALTKASAQEYARHGIRINALVPGAFDTPLFQRVLERAGGGNQAATDAVADHFRQLIALGRIGRPEEAAAAVLWLCSDRASYVTGQSMIVDGGLTAALR